MTDNDALIAELREYHGTDGEQAADLIEALIAERDKIIRDANEASRLIGEQYAKAEAERDALQMALDAVVESAMVDQKPEHPSSE